MPDLAEPTFRDSSGLVVLVVARELVLGSGAAVGLLTPPAMPVGMLHTTGLAEIFAIRDTDRHQSVG